MKKNIKDNTVKVNDIEIYLNDIYYYADKYISEELELSKEDQDYKQIVSDNFVSMILYIHDNIQKPSNDDIELLDDIFNIYVRLCSKYRVLPTLECFSFLTGIARQTFTDWMRGDYRIRSAHGSTAKKWLDTCRSFTVNRLSNQRGTDANLIFVAKAAYGMAEAVPTQPAEPQGIPAQTKEEIAAKYSAFKNLPEPEKPAGI